MSEISVTNKGQIIIPVRIRRKYGIQPGTRLSLIERDQEIVFKPLTKASVRKACGMLKSPTSATRELLTERGRDRKREDAKTQTGRTR
jgi:AbrB family looped-hinge helix DNA binding protein